MLFAFAYVRALSSKSLIPYVALATSPALFKFVKAGATSTIKTAMIPVTTIISISVKASRLSAVQTRCLSLTPSFIARKERRSNF